MNHQLDVSLAPRILSSRVIEHDANVVPCRNAQGDGLAWSDDGLHFVDSSGVVRSVVTFTDKVHAPAHLPALPMSLAEDGRRALVPLSDGDGCSLWSVDSTGKRQLRWRLSGPGWMVGVALEDGWVACVQQLGETPSYSVVVNGRAIHSDVNTLHPVCAPAVWERWLLLLLVLQPDPWTRSGAATLCAIDLHAGSNTPLPLANGAGERIEVAAAAEHIVTIRGRRRDQVFTMRR
jgi:hypothetical protein